MQRIDNSKTVAVSLNKGVKPIAIDSLGNLAIQQKLSPCGLDSLKALENIFTVQLLESDPNEIFTVIELKNFSWKPLESSGFVKTDIINKFQSP